MQKKSFSVNMKFILTTSISIIVLIAVILTYNITSLTQASRKQAASTLEALARSGTAFVDEWVTQYANLITTLSHVPHLEEYLTEKRTTVDEETLEAYLIRLTNIYEAWESANIVTPDGKIAISSQEGLAGLDVTQFTYFQEAMKRQIYFEAMPFTSSATKRLITIIAAPIMIDGSVKGLFTVAIDWEFFLNISFERLKIGKTGYVSLIDQSSQTILAHKDPKQRLRTPQNNAYRSAILAHRPGSKIFTEDGKRYVMGHSTLQRIVWENNSLMPNVVMPDWTVFAIQEEIELLQPIYYSVAVAVVISMTLVAGLITINAIVFASQVTKKIGGDPVQIASLVDLIAQGNLNVNFKEKGLLGHKNNQKAVGILGAMMTMTYHLRGAFNKIRESSSILAGNGIDLAAETKETSVGASSIAQNIEDVKSLIKEQTHSLDQTVHNIESSAQSLITLNEKIENQAISLAESTSAIQEMLANMQAAGQNAQRLSESFKTLTETSDLGKNLLYVMGEQIRQASNQSQTLQEANEAIQNLASQTNLLAMNAAIEAAHAGDAGRGFAVVAQEISSLADKANEQALATGSNLSAIKTVIEHIAGGSDQAQDAFNQILGIIKALDQSQLQIKHAMAEQNAGSKEILTALEEMNRITVQVRTESNAVVTNNNSIIQAIEQLQNISEQVRNAIEGVDREAGMIHKSMDLVVNLVEKNRQLIDIVDTEINHFKIDKS